MNERNINLETQKQRDREIDRYRERGKKESSR